MAHLSETEQDWNERVKLSNYRCRDCREVISFQDQESYFQQGLCGPCLKVREEERKNSQAPQKRLEEIRSRLPQNE